MDAECNIAITVLTSVAAVEAVILCILAGKQCLRWSSEWNDAFKQASEIRRDTKRMSIELPTPSLQYAFPSAPPAEANPDYPSTDVHINIGNGKKADL